MTSRSRRRLTWLVALVGLYAVAGFIVLPPIVRSQLAEQLSIRLGRPVSIERVRINPFMLSVSVEDLKVHTPDGSGTFAGWRRLKITFGALASLSGDWVLSDIVLDGLQANVEVNAKGALNFADILDRFTAGISPMPGPMPPPPPDSSRAVRIGRLEVNGAQVDFTDRSRPAAFHTLIGPMNFALVEFRTTGSAGAASRFEATTESGEKFNWVGTLSASPFASTGEWRVENVHLAKYSPYLATWLAGRIVAGDLGSTGHYELSCAPEARRFVVRETTAQLKGLRVVEPGDGDRPAFELASLQVTGIAADVFAARVTVDNVEMDSGHASLRRDADGTLNLLALLVPAKPAAPPVAPTPLVPAGPLTAPARPFGLAVKEVALRDFTVAWRDLAVPHPVQIDLTKVDATVHNVSLDPGTAIPLDLTFAWAPQGTAHFSGDLMLQPMQADLALELASIPLAQISPYAETFSKARITHGTASLKGHATVALAAGAAPNVRFAGEAHLNEVAIVDSARGADLAGFWQLSLTGLKLSALPRLAVAVDQIEFGAPYARIVRDARGILNVGTLIAAGGPGAPALPPAPATVAAPAAPADAPDVTIGQFTLTGGDFTFADQSLHPAVQAALENVTVSLHGLSSSTHGELQVHAMADGTSPFEIVGRVSPFGKTLFADLKVTGRSVDLLPAAPYVGRFAGYELERGRLTLDVTARLEGQALDLRNAITLDQFTLGAATNSPDAVKLPVKLGVALLKDSNGRIVLDVPVRGSLADPNFQVGGVIGHVLTNLLAKAATAPFALLGSMFGGGGEELGQDEFVPGGTVLAPESIKRLDTVRRALADRPALNLEIRGGYDVSADVAVLQRRKLDDLVRHRAWDAQRARDSRTAPFEQYQPAPADYSAALAQLFAEKFPAGAASSSSVAAAVEPPAAVAAAPVPDPEPATATADAPPAPEHRNFFRRITDKVTDVVTLKAYRERRAERRAAAKAEEEQAAEAQTAAPAAAAPTSASTAASTALSPDDMKTRLAATMTVSPDELRALADARAQLVRSRLIEGGGIAPERVRIAATVATQAARVTLHLE